MVDLHELVREVHARQAAGRMRVARPASAEAIERADTFFRGVAGRPIPTDMRAFYALTDGLHLSGHSIDALEDVVVTSRLLAEQGDDLVVLGGDSDLFRYLFRPRRGWLRVDFHDWEEVEETYDSFHELATDVVRDMLATHDAFTDDAFTDDSAPDDAVTNGRLADDSALDDSDTDDSATGDAVTDGRLTDDAATDGRLTDDSAPGDAVTNGRPTDNPGTDSSAIADSAIDDSATDGRPTDDSGTHDDAPDVWEDDDWGSRLG